MVFLLYMAVAFAEPNKSTCSQAELKSAICWSLCRRDGFDTGSFLITKKSCLCSNVKAFEQIAAKTIKIHKLFQSKPKPEDDYFYGY